MASHAKNESETSKVFVVLEFKKRFSKKEVQESFEKWKSKNNVDAMLSFVEKPDPTFQCVTEHLEKQKFNPFLLQECARKMCVRGDTSKYLRKLPKNALPSVNATRVQELKGLPNEVDIDNIGV